MNDYAFLLLICTSAVILFFGSLVIAASMLSSLQDQQAENTKHD